MSKKSTKQRLSRRQQYEAAYTKVSDLPWVRHWHREILKRIYTLIGETDEFTVDLTINTLVHDFEASLPCREKLPEHWGVSRATGDTFSRFFGVRWTDAYIFTNIFYDLCKYPPEVARAAIEDYLYPRRRAKAKEAWRH